MSGGVDSSVTAHLLKEQGYDVVGVFMKCYNIDGCAEADAEDARRVAEHIGIPFYVWDFEQEYKDRVVQYMIEGYRAGITPNPDVMCNREIKFGLFLEKALASGADYVATGHYVKIWKKFRPQGKTILNYLRRTIRTRTSHIFCGRSASASSRIACFRSAGSKSPRFARSRGVPVCRRRKRKIRRAFVSSVNFRLDDFLKQYIPEHRGALMTTAGEKIGEHSGAEFYTVGQRHIDADFTFPKTGGAGVNVKRCMWHQRTRRRTRSRWRRGVMIRRCIAPKSGWHK